MLIGIKFSICVWIRINYRSDAREGAKKGPSTFGRGSGPHRNAIYTPLVQKSNEKFMNKI